MAGIAGVLDRGDESRSQQIGILLDRIRRLSRLEDADERRQEATVLNRQVKALLPHSTTAAMFHKAVTGAVLGKAPPSWLDRYAERSTILPGVARATRNFHDALFPVAPRIEGDLAVRSAGIAGEVAGLIGVGGLGAAAKAAGGLRDGGRRFIRSLDEIQRQKTKPADDVADSSSRSPDVSGESKDGVTASDASELKLKDTTNSTPERANPSGNFNLPPVTRVQAEQEYRALNMPEASTDLWVDIRTNKRGFLDAHENGSHGGHLKDLHITISDQGLEDRVNIRGYRVASRFFNQEIAEAAISRVFDVRQTEITEWFHKVKVGSKKEFSLPTPLGSNRELGKSFRKGGSDFESKHSVLVVLKKMSSTEFRIFTGYPQ